MMKHVNQTNHIQPSSDVAVVVAEDEANGDDERLVDVVIVVVVIEAATIQKHQDLYISHEVEEVTSHFCRTCLQKNRKWKSSYICCQG